MTKEELAKWLHDNYEAVAKEQNWNTQQSCRVEFDTLPDANKLTMIEIADRLLNFNLLRLHFVMPSLHTWTDADIDAAYIMGAINADAVKADEGDVFPSLSKVKKELERLKELGFDRPYKALKAIRYPSNGA